jgi:hypothetical protein
MIESMEGAPPRPPADWNNPKWVWALMNHPGELALLEQVATTGNETLQFYPGSGMHEDFVARTNRDSRAAAAAGGALATLYALECAGWTLPHTPHKELVEHCVRFKAEWLLGNGLVDSADIVMGERQIKKACWDGPQEVAHLWAAYYLAAGAHVSHALIPTRLVDSNSAILEYPYMRIVLGIARHVQDFAQSWVAPRSARIRKGVRVEQPAQLLGSKPRLVPPDVPPLDIPWAEAPSPPLREALETFERRPR